MGTIMLAWTPTHPEAVGMDGGASAYAASKFGIRGLTQCAGLYISVAVSTSAWIH